MSNLLLLADVASKNTSISKSSADASVQTDFCDFGNNKPQSFHNFWTSNANDGNNGHNFDLPNLPPLHDYVKQTEFDYLVNSTHDYYNRTAAPDRELEHSYAFFDGGTSDATTSGNGAFFDDGCFEAIANLDEYMGISSQSDQSLLCEEVIQEEPFILDGTLELRSGTDELFDQLSIGSADVQAVIQLDELDVDELVRYILPRNETAETNEANVGNQRSGDPDSTNEDAVRTQGDERANFPSLAEVGRPNDSPKSIQCQWANCGRLVEATSVGSLEKHILDDHCGRNNGERLKSNGWPCRWSDCERKEPFLQRYQLIRHLRRHTLEAPFQCVDCQRAFKSKELLKVHARRFHNYGKTYSCQVCGKLFASTGDLSRHRRTHLPKTPSNFFCDVCRISYKDESGLRKHRQKNHASGGQLNEDSVRGRKIEET